MTNTNDFRRYSYQTDASYALNAFSAQRSSQLPKLKPEADEIFKVRENKKVKSTAELKKEQKLAFAKMVKIAVVAVICLAMVGLVINSLAQKNELTRQISEMQEQIENAQSENISLQSELDSLVSMSMIDQYAVEKLGMKKIKSNQVQYIDVSEYKAAREKSINKQSPAKTAEQLSNK